MHKLPIPSRGLPKKSPPSSDWSPGSLRLISQSRDKVGQIGREYTYIHAYINAIAAEWALIDNRAFRMILLPCEDF